MIFSSEVFTTFVITAQSLCRVVTIMGLHDQILKALTKELLEKVAHFGAGNVKDLKKNSEELLTAFQKKISKFINFIRLAKFGLTNHLHLQM